MGFSRAFHPTIFLHKTLSENTFSKGDKTSQYTVKIHFADHYLKNSSDPLDWVVWKSNEQ